MDCFSRGSVLISFSNSTYADSKVESYLGGFIAGPIKVSQSVDVRRDGDDQIDTWRDSVASVQNQIKAVEATQFHTFSAGTLTLSHALRQS